MREENRRLLRLMLKRRMMMMRSIAMTLKMRKVARILVDEIAKS